MIANLKEHSHEIFSNHGDRNAQAHTDTLGKHCSEEIFGSIKTIGFAVDLGMS